MRAFEAPKSSLSEKISRSGFDQRRRAQAEIVKYSRLPSQEYPRAVLRASAPSSGKGTQSRGSMVPACTNIVIADSRWIEIAKITPVEKERLRGQLTIEYWYRPTVSGRRLALNNRIAALKMLPGIHTRPRFGAAKPRQIA